MASDILNMILGGGDDFLAQLIARSRERKRIKDTVVSNFGGNFGGAFARPGGGTSLAPSYYNDEQRARFDAWYDSVINADLDRRESGNYGASDGGFSSAPTTTASLPTGGFASGAGGGGAGGSTTATGGNIPSGGATSGPTIIGGSTGGTKGDTSSSGGKLRPMPGAAPTPEELLMMIS